MDSSRSFFGKLRTVAVRLEKEVKQLEQALRGEKTGKRRRRFFGRGFTHGRWGDGSAGIALSVGGYSSGALGLGSPCPCASVLLWACGDRPLVG